ncbi:hypothetical protein M1563_03180 [Patescibacteria group bacterium]|nr:hypothetical protein [Patescibacteria group bacterium]MCL5409780.1 hypothetical protein [Patescibacteria group bacterium]
MEQQRIKNKRLLVIPIIVLVVIIYFVGRSFFNKPAASNNNNTPLASQTSNNSLSNPVATTDVNKDFTFSIPGTNGAEATDIKYTIQNAELRKDILVQGQKATAVSGRLFLILNLKLSNTTDKTVTVNTRNYVRLALDDNTSEWFAPDIHNDPVEVQPISVKQTRIGFPVDQNIKHFKIQVGEIDGDKSLLDLNF